MSGDLFVKLTFKSNRLFGTGGLIDHLILLFKCSVCDIKFVLYDRVNVQIVRSSYPFPQNYCSLFAIDCCFAFSTEGVQIISTYGLKATTFFRKNIGAFSCCGKAL